MPGRLRIFISSTMEDLEGERDMVAERLRAFNFEPVNAEAILPNGATSWDRITQELDSCQLLVLILGRRYGWVPVSGPLADLGVSVTHGEYLRARELGIPVLPFFKRLGYSEPRDSEDAVRRDRFRQEVEAWVPGQFRAEFRLPRDLADKVGFAITGMLADHFQRDALRTERLPAPARMAQGGDIVLPPALVHAVKSKRAILFCGSGVSLAAGLPSSAALAGRLAGMLQGADPAYAPAAVGSAFASVATDFQLMFSHDALVTEMSSLLDLSDDVQPANAHLTAVDLFPRIVTTNYDLLFERAVEKRDPDRLSITGPVYPAALPERFLLKLHGSYTVPESLVITETDLADFETSHRAVLAETARLFRDQLVLVVGSSLRDPSILRLFHALRAELRGYCLVPFGQTLARSRLRGLGLEAIEGSIEAFFPLLAEAVL